jgi:hypothetical protein
MHKKKTTLVPTMGMVAEAVAVAEVVVAVEPGGEVEQLMRMKKLVQGRLIRWMLHHAVRMANRRPRDPCLFIR